MNIKKLILLTITVIMFFSFNINEVIAKDVDKSGTCTYNITIDKKKFSKIKIKQDKVGKISHLYYDSSEKKYVDIKNSKIGNFYIENNTSPIDKCPVGGIKVFKPVKAKSGVDEGGNEIRYANEYEGYDYVISWCVSSGITGCTGVSETLGYFDKQNNTDSTKKYQEGTCEYSNNILPIKVSQDKNGKVTYKYKEDGSWKSTKKKTSNGKTVTLNSKSKPKKGFSKCPTIAYIEEKKNKITVGFAASCPTAGSTPRPNSATYQCVSAKGTENFEKKSEAEQREEYENLKNYDTNNDLFKECDKGDVDCKGYNRCEDILGEDLVEKLQEIVNIIRIMVPILLIVFGTIDFGKAIFAGDENEMKKAQSRFIKRLIIAIGFFIIPSILQLLLNIAAKVWNIQDPSFCGIKF